MSEIIRQRTAEERNTSPSSSDGNSTGFIDIAFKEDVAKEKFEKDLSNEFQKAMKKGLPFADKVARAEFNEYYQSQANTSMKKNGFVVLSEIKPIKIDWSRYSDLDNFILLDEGETADSNLTKHNPGLNVQIAWKKYQFKGYGDGQGKMGTYAIMESGPNAILRARKNLRELEDDSKPKDKRSK